MAKKNSSKTATKEALQRSEPRLQVFSGWQGMNIKNAPNGWQPRTEGGHNHNQQDLKPTFFMIQNNMETADNLTVETRPDSIELCEAPLYGESKLQFTGVACLYRHFLICACRGNGETDSIWWQDIGDDPDIIGEDGLWNRIALNDAEESQDPIGYTVTEIGYYEKKLIVLTKHRNQSNEWESEIFTGDIYYDEERDTLSIGTDTGLNQYVRSAHYIDDPVYPLTLTPQGMRWNTTGEPEHDGDRTINMTTRVSIYYTYTNEFGSTKAGKVNGHTLVATVWTELNPVAWSSAKYLKIDGEVPAGDIAKGVTGIDLFCTLDNNVEEIFIGHVDLSGRNGATPWTYNWLGALTDTSQWTTSQLKLPGENTTKGVSAQHFACHDSRLYFWGDPSRPYTLYIGGNPGSELSIARGLGGAWVDIEPGTGYEVKGTAKWKTVSGANIVTIMCGNKNTNKVKRFNLVETNIVMTNEVQSKGYMYEEVSNVVGCNSRWGYGVFGDGLYSIGRYGLMLTTMAMEYNSQMRAQSVSEAVEPVFTDQRGVHLSNARMVCINDIVYIALADPEASGDNTDMGGQLVQIILCYDLNLKAWYTFTHDEKVDDNATYERIKHIMAIDSQDYEEGLGVITANKVILYPTAGGGYNIPEVMDEVTPPPFSVVLETGELPSKMPKQEMYYIEQLELRFDYFVGDGKCYIEGVDYYGRPFKVEKTLNRKGVGHMMRDYTEWIRIGRYVESYRIRIEGKMRCRLVSMNAKAYTVSKRVGLPYGYDASSSHLRRSGQEVFDHHYVKDYNSLRRALVT